VKAGRPKWLGLCYARGMIERISGSQVGKDQRCVEDCVEEDLRSRMAIRLFSVSLFIIVSNFILQYLFVTEKITNLQFLIIFTAL